MREHARNYAIYLRRRAEDFAEPDRPIPKWSDLDHEAVKVVLDEFERLQHANAVANEALRKNGIKTGQGCSERCARPVRLSRDPGPLVDWGRFAASTMLVAALQLGSP
jgi:hypothetical protein